MDTDWDAEWKALTDRQAADKEAAVAPINDRYLERYRARGLDLDDLNADERRPITPRGHNEWAQALPRGKFPISASPYREPSEKSGEEPSPLSLLGAWVAAVRVDYFLLSCAAVAIVSHLL